MAPIFIPGEKEPIASNKIDRYVTNELLYYYQFYLNTKSAGMPFSCGWIEWPAWVVQLLNHFDHALESVKRYHERL